MDSRNFDQKQIGYKKRIRSRVILLTIGIMLLTILISSVQDTSKQFPLPIILSNGDFTKCEILEITTDVVKIRYQGKLTEIPIPDIVNFDEIKEYKTNLDKVNKLGDGTNLACDYADQLAGIQKKLLDQAYSLLGRAPKSYISIRKKNICLDCIGTVSAVFWGIGIDIQKDAGRYRGNGVSRLYQSLRDKGAISNTKMPSVGDIIFWDNTWDRNKDGKDGDDPLTHVGVVVKVDSDGTVHYLHENYYLGVVVEQMNLYKPTVYKDVTGKVINSAMYSGSSERRHPKHWLSGDLWKIHGTLLEVKDQYK